jgi:hypothetical protein
MSIARNMSKVSVDTNGYVQPISLSNVDGSLFSSKIQNSLFPSGSSIQMVSMLYQSYNSVTIDNLWVNVPNMLLSITPTTVNSKIKIDVRWFGEVSSAWDDVFGITRNGTIINLPTGTSNRNAALGMPVQTYIADDNNSTPELCFITTIDTPATISPVTYRLVARANTSRTLMTGRVFDSVTQQSNYEQGSCEIILTEYAG